MVLGRPSLGLVGYLLQKKPEIRKMKMMQKKSIKKKEIRMHELSNNKLLQGRGARWCWAALRLGLSVW